MKRRDIILSLMAAAAAVTLAAPAGAQTLDKFPFRLNWTLYGEHAPFFVARDKGFYKDEGLDVEILEGSGSTTVAQLVANPTNPVAYVDAATMMRGINAGMPIKAVGVTLQQSPMSFIYRADNPRPTKIEEIKDSRIAITAGDASLAIFTAFMGKLNMKVSDVKLITVANPAAKEQAVLGRQADALLGYFMDQGPRMQLKSGVKMGWTPALRHGRHHDLEQRHHRQQRLGSRTPRTRISSSASCGVATRLGIHRQKSRRGGRDLHQACAGLQHGDRAARDQRHDDDHPLPSTPRANRCSGRPRKTGRRARICWRNTPRWPRSRTWQILHQRVSGAAAIHAEEVAPIPWPPPRSSIAEAFRPREN